jgi:uncharacterized protein (TIGR02598 family)
MATVLFPRPPQRASTAFSLVEVTLALGIVSVSLLSLIGLLPAGLGVLRESMDQTVHAQIIQRIAAGLSTADFASHGGGTQAFDQEGQLVGTGANSTVRYHAMTEESEPSLPGLTEQEDVRQMQGHLKRIRIGITRSDVPNAPVVWYAIQVAAR